MHTASMCAEYLGVPSYQSFFSCIRLYVQVPELVKKDCLLFYYPECEGLAMRIAEVSNGSVELAEINWK